MDQPSMDMLPLNRFYSSRSHTSEFRIHGVLDGCMALTKSVVAGGRQIDGSISSLLALENIMQSSKVREAQASGKLTILFDSGIRTGSDIFRAIALGAQGVLREYSRSCPPRAVN